MRYLINTLFVITICISGCSGGDAHRKNQPGKIQLDTKRWYTLNNSGVDINQLFDTIVHQKLNLGSGKLLENYEIWYPLLDGESITIDGIQLYDYQGTPDQRPTRIYAITSDWQRITLADFVSTHADKWVGPNPLDLSNFNLEKPIGNIRYIVINTWGNLPTEIEFYGKYQQAESAKPIVTHYPLHNFFGVNGFEWNFEDPKNSGSLDMFMLNAVKSFTGFRHYLDWEKIENKEGKYTFNPARNGSWNYDTLYQWCKENNMPVLVCLKDNPPWMLETYPADQRNNENIPVRFGNGPENAESYVEQAKLAFQFAARYGRNTTLASDSQSMIKVDTTPRWTNDVVNKVKTGLGYINYMECGNEPDKWWKGRKAYQSGREYAANLSAFYDGNKGALGPGAGVKNADSSMKVVMAGVATPTPDYLKGIIDWCKEFRGLKSDGSLNLPFDVVNYHYYSSEYAGNTGPNVAQNTKSGVAPELSNTEQNAKSFFQAMAEYGINLPVWVTETGYDLNQGSPVHAKIIGKKSAEETQADWNLRAALLYSRLGINRVFFYELYDDNGSALQYGTCGLINKDKSRRASADYFYQVNAYFGDFIYNSTLKQDNETQIDAYEKGTETMYVVCQPNENPDAGKTALLNLPGADTAYVYTPKIKSNEMSLEKVVIKNQQATITVTNLSLIHI